MKQILFILFFISLLNLQRIDNTFIIQYLLTTVQIGVFLFYLSQDKLIFFKKINAKKKYLVLLFYLVFLICILRANEFSILILINFLGFNLFFLAYVSELIFIYENEKLSFKDIFENYIITPFVFYISLNFVCWVFNIKSDLSVDSEINIGQSMILANYGINVERVNFLFSNGINSYAVVLGAIFTYTLSNLFLTLKFSLKNIVFNLIIFVCLLLTDSRSGVFYPIFISIFCFVLLKIKKYKIIKFTPYLLFLAPFALLGILPLLSELEFVAQFSRNDSDLFTLNGRLFIWYFALDEFIQFKLIHLFGYGYYGHVTSGASSSWAFLFGAYLNPDTVHPHNSIFSLLFDIGYLGILVIISIFFTITKILVKHWKNDKIFTLNLYSYILFTIFISITESFIGLYYLNTMTLFVSFFVFLFAMDSLKSKDND